MQIPRSLSPRKRGYERLGMTRKKSLSERLKLCPPGGPCCGAARLKACPDTKLVSPQPEERFVESHPLRKLREVGWGTPLRALIEEEKVTLGREDAAAT